MALLSSLVATGVGAWFAARLLRQWWASRSRPMAWWGTSVAMFSLASAMLLVSELAGWSAASFRVFYLFGAVLNVPFLAAGSVEVNLRSPGVTRATGVVAVLTGLLFLASASGDGGTLALWGAVLGCGWGGAMVVLASRPRLVGLVTIVALGAFAAAGLLRVLPTALVTAIPATGIPEGRELFDESVRSLAVGGNAVGSIVVILGALFSAAAMAWGNADADVRAQARARARRFPIDALALALFRGWRAAQRAGLAHLAVGNLLIALGVLIAAMSGTVFGFLGETSGHAIGLGAGVSVMAAGFARTQRPLQARAVAPSAPGTAATST